MKFSMLMSGHLFFGANRLVVFINENNVVLCIHRIIQPASGSSAVCNWCAQREFPHHAPETSSGLGAGQANSHPG